jgi:pyruvate dehydrogenase E1 component
MKVVPDQLSPWLPGRLVSLGTDGFGRSDNRQHLRRFFEISSEAIVAATLSRLARDGKFDQAQAAQAIRDLGSGSGRRRSDAALDRVTPFAATA